ncbi:MAG: twin-arginine translocase subunit TatC [Chloroflexi bacterium]|nr:twin-arginine translocase subunit TatC [Chloroflexota bacterium]
MSEEKKFTLTEHLRELQRRVLRIAIVFAVTTGLSFTFTGYLFKVMMRPIPPGIQLIYTELPEMMGAYIKVGLISGFVLALPYMIVEIILFVAPGLRPKERKFMFAFVPSSLVLFAVGALFGYFVLLPPAINFLVTFGTEFATPAIRVSNYVSVISRLLFWLGVIFELPLVAFLLAKIGMIGPRTLDKYRRHAIVGAFIGSAIITPTMDPINQILLAIPLIVLYEASIWLAKLARRQPRPTQASPGPV